MVIAEDLFLRSPLPILLIDAPTRTILHANEAFAELLDMPLHRIRQALVYDFDRGPADEVDEYLILAVACQDTRPRRRAFSGRNGTKVEVTVQAVPLGGDRGNRLALFVRDVRPEQRAEQDRNRLQAQLWMAQKHEAVGRLASGIAHDFNNTLSAILMTAESLQKRANAADTATRADLDLIVDASLKARSLTRELLAFSGKQQLQPRPTRMNQVVEDIEELLRRTLPEDINFVFRPSSSSATVNADPTQMQQVLLNLVMNARDAMPGGGYLVVRVDEVDLSPEFARDYASVRPGPHVMLSVTDTGIGMEEETRNRIFEPFFSTRERGTGGSGMGLATVYGIVKQSGGSIWVTSESGVGTTFRVYLPRLATGLPPSASASREAAIPAAAVEAEIPASAGARAVSETSGDSKAPPKAPPEAPLEAKSEPAFVAEPGAATSATRETPAELQAPIQEVVTEALGDAPRGSEHVLLVEDEKGVRRMATRVLRDLGYVVTTAETPREALQVHQELWPERGPHPIDILLTDIVMPGMSGVELAERLLEKRADLPVLYMSGYLDPIDESDRPHPSEARIAKPFTQRELAEAMRALLDVPMEPSPFVF